MKQKKMKFNSLSNVLSAFVLMVVVMFFTAPVLAQTNNKNNASISSDAATFELFNEQIPAGAQWKGENRFVRKINSKNLDEQTNYLYVPSSDSPAKMTGLSIPIRENPGSGEYRYITFAWIKWGNDLQIGMHFGHKVTSNSTKQIGEKYNYTYAAGKGDAIKNALMISDNGPGNWTYITRDLWKDFGEFTLTNVSFICPSQRDAGFDAIFLGRSQDAFVNAPKLLPSQIAASIAVKGDDDMSLSDTSTSDSSDQPQKVNIDWASQVKAGGFMMYPLYLVGLMAIVIALQRMMTTRQSRMAPKQLCSIIRDNLLSGGNLNTVLEACDKYPSTLAESLRFIFKHRNAGREVVSQTAGDIAARDIREHLSRIYPLSIIASLSPLLGLLGTIVGMIEAFGLVALYGDEGGSAILSDSISKALITTAAGLIIAAPSVAIYFVIKKKIMSLASLIEVEIENVITKLYLSDDSTELTTSKHKEDRHAPIN